MSSSLGNRWSRKRTSETKHRNRFCVCCLSAPLVTRWTVYSDTDSRVQMDCETSGPWASPSPILRQSTHLEWDKKTWRRSRLCLFDVVSWLFCGSHFGVFTSCSAHCASLFIGISCLHSHFGALCGPTAFMWSFCVCLVSSWSFCISCLLLSVYALSCGI